MRDLLKFIFLPPGLFFIAGAAGFWLRQTRPRAGAGLIAGTLSVFALFCMPVTTWALMGLVQLGVEPLDPDGPDIKRAQAIVILGGGIDQTAPEYGGKGSVDDMTLMRLRYGARLHRDTHLPILVSGGLWGKRQLIIADLMAESLEKDFLVRTRWKERQSTNTWENAIGSADLLRADNIATVLLVTHAWHMPRSQASFERAGLTVIAAPTAFERGTGFRMRNLVPSAKAFHMNYYGTHELLGRLWYWVVS